MGKYLIKSIVANDTTEHVAADTGSNYKFKWLDYLVDDLRKAFSNFKTVWNSKNRHQHLQTTLRGKGKLMSIVWNIFDQYWLIWKAL